MTQDMPRGPSGSGPPAPSRSEIPQPFRFTGRAGEFFGIWIANLALTLVTLGIFSAWAKVRQNRYLLGHTRILGHPMEYRARGLTILVGRLLSLLVLAGIGGLGTVSLAAQGLSSLGLLLAIPWVINRSLRFRARVTAWRNIRFDWHGTYWGAFTAFILWPAAGIFSLGLLAPLAARASRQYLASHHSFGGTRFTAATTILPYYIAALWALLSAAVISLLGAGLAVLVLLVRYSSHELRDLQNAPDLAASASLPLGLTTIVAIFAAGIVFLVLARNILIRNLRLGQAAAFHSDLSAFRSVWIVLTNTLLTVLSLGLLYPWARIRWRRYQVERLAVTRLMPLNSFVDAARKAEGAFGEEFSDFEGFGPAI